MGHGKWSATISFVLLACSFALAQEPTHIRSVSVLPATCTGGNPALSTDMVVLISVGVGTAEICSSTNTWTAIGAGGGGSLPVATTLGQVPVSVAAGTTYSAQSKPVVDVRDYSGADWCAQVNAADTAFVGSQVILSVPSALSGLAACTNQITLTANHDLQFGAGSFDMGTATSRAGIFVGHAISNVTIGGDSRATTLLYYTSHNIGGGNAFPMGAAIALGGLTCATIADAAQNIRIHDLHIIDRNTGSALGASFNPSAVAGFCLNNITVENNQFTDIKGNAAITLTASWSTFTTASGYMDRNNIFDGTVAGGGGEFTADNSANWTNFTMMNNIISDYPCGIGVSHGFNGLITGNTVDMTQKAKFGNCPGIALGSLDATVGDLQATNNIITLGSNSVTSAVIGMGFFPKAATAGSTEMVISGNIIREVANGTSGPTTGIYITGTDAGKSPPPMVVRNNVTTTSYATAIAGAQVSDIEVSNNYFGGSVSHGNVPFFNCAAAGSPAILAGSSVRVFGNRYFGTSPGGVADNCTNASFSTRQFQEWDNTIADGNPFTNFAASGYLGKTARVLWTPGTIAAYTSTANQTATITQAIAGDKVGIINANGGTLLSLPAGVIASGSVTAANTVTFTLTNTTSAPVTINGGLQIGSYVTVDRPPNNAQASYFALDGSAAHTTISASGQITSTVATGTAPLVIASTTNVANLNASSLSGATFAAPGTIGGGTPGAATFTTLSATSGTFSGPPGIATGTASNTDLAGQLTLSTGTITYNFVGTYASAPICVATDVTAANAVQVSVTTTVLTINGTGSDVVDYVCVGRN